jgi:hypothetical protein
LAVTTASHVKASLFLCVCGSVSESGICTESIGMHQNYKGIYFVKAEVKRRKEKESLSKREK